jgi:superfamily I DNA/RNA helicase
MELGSWLQEQTYSIRHRCTTKPFLVFCEELLFKYGVLSGNEIKDQTFYDELPLRMLEIIDLHNIKFDAIIVDEGQSFNTDWWIVINQMLVDKEKSYRYIFYDDLQRIYEEQENHVPGEDQSIDLTVNIRNTASIHQKAIRFLPRHNPLPKCNNIRGEEPWFSIYQDEISMKNQLQSLLTSLIRDGRVSSKDIVILRGKKKTSRIIDDEKLGPFILSSLEEISNPAAIRFTTIQSFRGMERRVVILTELDDEINNIEQLNYLGASRAKTMLAYLVSDKIHPNIRTILQENCYIRN